MRVTTISFFELILSSKKRNKTEYTYSKWFNFGSGAAGDFFIPKNIFSLVSLTKTSQPSLLGPFVPCVWN